MGLVIFLLGFNMCSAHEIADLVMGF